MSDFGGRGRGGGRGSRSRGGPLRGGPRGSGRGGFGDRDGGRGGFRGRGRGDGFSRGRGGPPRHMSRDDDSPPRKVPMMSRGYDGDRGRGPMSRRCDRYDDSYDRPLPPRSRDPYPPSPSRDSGRLIDRLSPPRSSLRDRDYGLSSRGGSDYPSSRGDYLSPRSYSPQRDSGYRDSYNSAREDRRDSFSRGSLREYTSPRTADYVERSRDFRDSPRDYGSSRDYPPARGSDFRDTLGGRNDFRDLPPRDLGRDRLPARDYDDDDFPPRGGGLSQSRGGARYDDRSNGRDFSSRGRGPNDSRAGGHSRDLDHGDRDYGSSRFSRMDDRVHSRGPPSRDYGGRGSMRGGRDDRGGRGGFVNGSRGRGGPPRGRGRPEFSRGRGGRWSPPPSRDGPLGKRPRADDGGYSRR